MKGHQNKMLKKLVKMKHVKLFVFEKTSLLDDCMCLELSIDVWYALTFHE